MSRQTRTNCALFLLVLVAATGCQPSQPFYLTGRPGDMSHYLDKATELEYPDADTPPSPEAEQAIDPLTLSNPEPREMWDLTLEDAISTAINNSKIIRRLFHVGGSSQGAGSFLGSTTASLAANSVVPLTDGTTIYDPAVVESDPNQGVEAALSNFDAQLSASIFFNKTDRPQNVAFFNAVTQSDVADFQAQISKRYAGGSQFFFRNTTNYDNGNTGGQFRALPSIYTTALEAEWRQPLLAGRGVAVNRAPIILARIRTDVDLADLEANVRNLLKDTEDAYWNLMFQYRRLEAAKTGRDSSLNAWRQQYNLEKGGRSTTQNESQAREQYYNFKAEVESALRDLYNAESNVRFMMGLAATDGRLVRPITEPTTAAVQFDWNEINSEALVRMPELRKQKWIIKARETDLIVSKNQLLPTFNAVALYRWLGVGDELTAADRNGVNFPNAGSRAFEELTEGRFQEVRFGAEFAMPIGFRRQLAGVRNSQLLISREKARLEDAELQVSHLLTTSMRGADGWYVLMQTQFNRLVAAKQEEKARRDLYITGANDEQGQNPINLLLDAQRRVANAQRDYYNAVIEYNKSISDIHYRKGSLLEYDGVQLAEGPWPQKAYYDAVGRARQRAASLYMNYGWTRPRVISQGPVDQESGGAGSMSSEGEMYEGNFEEVPSGRPTPAGSSNGPSNGTLRPTADPSVRRQPLRKAPQRLANASLSTESEAGEDEATSGESIAWSDHQPEAQVKGEGTFRKVTQDAVSDSENAAPASAVIRQVSHGEPTPAFKTAPIRRTEPASAGWRQPSR